MTPSCRSSRRRSSGRWRRSTEIWEQEDKTELRQEESFETRRLDSNMREWELETEERKLKDGAGAMCEQEGDCAAW